MKSLVAEPELSSIKEAEPDSTPAAPSALSELFDGYEALFTRLSQLRAGLFVPLGPGPVAHHILLPRLRPFCRYFLTHHVRTRLAALSQSCHYRLSTNPADETAATELNQIDHYGQAIGTVPIKRLLGTWISLGAALAFGVAHVLFSKTGAAPAIGKISDSLTGLLSGSLKSPVGSDPGSALLALVLVLTTVFAIGFLPLGAFQLKRLLFNTCRDSTERSSRDDRFTWAAKDGSHTITASDQASKSAGLYELERKVFAQYELKAPREWPWDLIARAAVVLVIVPMWLVLGFEAGHLIKELHLKGIFKATPWVGCALLAAVSPVWLLHLQRVWKRRQGAPVFVPPHSKGDPVFSVQVAPHDVVQTGVLFEAQPAGWMGRSLASLLDGAIVLVATFLVGSILFKGIFVIENDVVFSLVLLLAFLPLVGGVYTLLSARSSPGQTIGKRWQSIRVVTTQGFTSTWPRMLFREVVMKWLIGAGAAIFLLGLPALVNVAVGVFDRAHRTLTDLAAGTLVVVDTATRDSEND